MPAVASKFRCIQGHRLHRMLGFGLGARLLAPLIAYQLLTSHHRMASAQGGSGAMFQRRTAELIQFNTMQLNYGVAVSDVDNDGEMEWIVAGYNGPNMVLKFDKPTGKYINIAQPGSPYEALRDPGGDAIGVCACDVDGDGREEIYFLNTGGQYSGQKLSKDKLFKWRDGRYVDLFDDDANTGISSMFSGRSVACVDRMGSGKYGVLLATYAERGQGKFGLIEMDESHPENNVASGRVVLRNVATQVGINFSTGGRGITVGPILGNDGRSDIFFVNEGNPSPRFQNAGANALFKNRGDGTYEEVATRAGVADPDENGRGVALADFNHDGKLDIVYGNWNGPHRIFLQRSGERFENMASSSFAQPSPIRTVIPADFDNDGNLEVFLNNIAYRYGNLPTNNRLFRITPVGNDINIQTLDIGDAEEPDGYGTGAAVADMDGDGRLELLVSHGESMQQPLELYTVRQGEGNSWLRVMPLTLQGAPARGASVLITMADGTKRLRVIDGGSGYLCQMEPVAHFGLGRSHAVSMKVMWPDGHEVTKELSPTDVNKGVTVRHTGAMDNMAARGGNQRAASPSSSYGGVERSYLPIGDRNRAGNTRSQAGRCHTRRERNYLTDPETGCRSMRPTLKKVCSGTCSNGAHCCQATATRFRYVRFLCSGGVRRVYSKIFNLGARRCTCMEC